MFSLSLRFYNFFKVDSAPESKVMDVLENIVLLIQLLEALGDIRDRRYTPFLCIE